MPDQVHDTLYGIGPNYPALSVPDWESYGDWLPFKVEDGKKLIPFDGDGHWLLCFDYRQNGSQPMIALIDTESVSEGLVAGSFADYLQLLEPDVDEGQFGLTLPMDLESVKKRIASTLKMRIHEPEDWAHGYIQHRLSHQNGETQNSVWLSPNLVRHGFVRPDDKRCAELKDLMSDMVKRYPGLPEEAWILNTSEEIAPALVSILESLKVLVQPLEECHGLT